MPFIKMFAVASLPLVLLFFLVSLYLEPLQGDLTRVANLSERSWGWNTTQPVVDIDKNDMVPDPSVIVIGDSFSEGNVWQSVTQNAAGRRLLTFTWHDIGGAVCLDSALALLARDFPNTKIIVIESVERAFVNNFTVGQRGSRLCKERIKTSVRPTHGSTAAERIKFDLEKPILDPIYAVKALIAEREAFNATVASGDGYISPLNRADLFSNRRSDTLLFYHEDMQKKKWTTEQVSSAVQRAKRLSQDIADRGARLVMAVVPDKSTIYSKYLKHPVFDAHRDIWADLAAENVDSVRLDTLFAGEALTTLDFYLPNDTHLGTQGFITLGKAIAGHLKSEGIQ